ncbi:MAG: DUF2061 domain-containing protein [Flavobacteriaceae bacterium]|nr:DUF2061 domain-containing protein [Bacteroidia bacterium]NNK82475.1 DUF2061 domain-containing protein [Flavobacteriaceae bacterium]
MTNFKKESHLRSLIKGITWRFLATADTVLVVLLITCLTGNCSIEHAIKIGLVEFLLKLAVYYIHERVWQFALKDGVVSKKETLYKTISWRVIASAMTFIISGAILNAFDEIALYIALTESVSKFILYYIHERLWVTLPLGRIRKYVYGKLKNNER